MLRKVVSLFVIFVFLLTEITVDFYYLKDIRFSVARVYADTATPYCLPTNDGTKTGTFSQEMGYCVLDPEDSMGKCLSPYVYSTEYKKCITMPLCPGLYVWNSQTKQCESVSVPPSGDTEPIFPDNSCAMDSNDDGEIQQEEIHQCQQTPQGYICPVGQVQCDPQYQQPSCPEQYTYNPQTQKCEYTPTVGVCSSQQVPVTQYQCPVNGQIYSDLNQCNSACIQTAQCSGSPIYPTLSGGGDDDEGLVQFVASGGGYWIKDGKYYEIRLYVNGCTFSSNSFYSTSGCTFSRMYANGGSTIQIYEKCVNCDEWGNCTYNERLRSTISISGCTVTGNMDIWSYGRALFVTISGNSYVSNFGGSLTFNYNTPQYNYTCPLPGGSSCTGDPPTCTAGQSCVTYDSTVTKWQCSLNGTQYDTQEQCTTSCYSGCPSGGIFNPSTGKCEATATCQTGTLQAEGCFTGYGCPLGQYQCHNINNTWMCSSHQCITSNQLQDEGDVIPSGYEDDGPRDEQGNCLGTIYIFNGKGMRCRKSGVQTGFHNCCNESQGKLYDSTGSIGGGIGAIKDVAKVISATYTAIRLGSMASNIATQGGWVMLDYSTNTAKAFFTGSGQVWQGSFEEGMALVSGLSSSNSFTIENVGNQVITRFNPGGNADLAAGTTMSDFVKNSGVASSVVSLATSFLISDPVLSSAVNTVAQAVLWSLGYAGPMAFASAVLGLAMSLFMARCDKQDIMTSTFKESGYCHEVGEYCVKRIKFIGCVQKAKGHCCFNSKLARIIHEQGRPQLAGFGASGGWGDPKNPNCRGFLPEEFQALDFNKIDLSEYIEDIQRNIRRNLAPQIQQQIQESWGW